MSEHDMQPSLGRLASLAAGRPSLMSSLMQLYREQEGMNDQQLAAFLECEAEALPRLALCRRPRQAPDFRGDIEAIAAHTGANPNRLAGLVRAAESLQALRSGHEANPTTTNTTPNGNATPSTLMAARDYDEPAGGEDDASPGGETGEDDSH
jgi:hypothetical protein